MPCRSDYQEPNERELELSKVYGLLDEIITGKLPEDFGNGFDSRIYNKGLSQQHLDDKTKLLCSKLQKMNVKKYSLEMQMWWRDHQEADKKRVKKELEEVKEEKARKKAIEKLTPYERKLLNI